MACGSRSLPRSSLLSLPAAVPSHIAPQGSIPGEAVILVAYIPRRFSQLIVSSVPRLAVPSGREDKQTAGGKASR